MICLETVEKYCKEYWKIENYEQAMNDKAQTWDCHHRHEIDWVLPQEELISIGRYYDVHYSELIFLTKSEHMSLHMKGENNPMYGKTHTKEAKEQIRQARLGKHLSEETLRKLRDALSGENNPMYGKTHSEETRKRMHEAKKGLHWYNNGQIEIFQKQRPKGFISGRLKTNKQK